MADRKSRTWGGRFGKAADPQLESFSSSVHFDVKLWPHDVRVSVAHVRMLAQQGILQKDEALTLLAGLE